MVAFHLKGLIPLSQSLICVWPPATEKDREGKEGWRGVEGRLGPGNSISTKDAGMLGESQPASPRIRRSAGISPSDAGETITAARRRKLIRSQMSVLITGKVKKTPLRLHTGSCQLVLLRAWETQSTMTVLIQLFSTM